MSALKQNYSYSTPGPPLRRARMGEAAEFTAGTTDEGYLWPRCPLVVKFTMGVSSRPQLFSEMTAGLNPSSELLALYLSEPKPDCNPLLWKKRVLLSMSEMDVAIGVNLDLSRTQCPWWFDLWIWRKRSNARSFPWRSGGLWLVHPVVIWALRWMGIVVVFYLLCSPI